VELRGYGYIEWCQSSLSLACRRLRVSEGRTGRVTQIPSLTSLRADRRGTGVPPVKHHVQIERVDGRRSLLCGPSGCTLHGKKSHPPRGTGAPPVGIMGKMPMPRQATTESFSFSSLRLYAFAPLRYPSLPFFSPPPRRGIRPRLRPYGEHAIVFDSRCTTGIH